MALKTFEAVAETNFPFLSVVELNSQGDPLLHPNIEVVLSRIAEHGCDVKIQHNGTLLTGAVVDLLCRQHGTLMLSLDAVGAKFDEVRRGGSWEKAATGLKRLLKERDPKRLSVGVYPTLTRRTIGEAENVLDWSAEHGVDVVTFHRYVPVTGSFEMEPADNEYERVKGRMRQWCANHADPLKLNFESENLNRTLPTEQGPSMHRSRRPPRLPSSISRRFQPRQTRSGIPCLPARRRGITWKSAWRVKSARVAGHKMYPSAMQPRSKLLPMPGWG